jgi:hypothetical protein
MQLADLSKPGEKKKVIVAGALGLVAILVLWWTLIGFDSGKPTVRPTASPTPARTQQASTGANDAATPRVNDLLAFSEISYTPSSYNAPDAKRNIFAYVEPPPPAAAPSTPTPTPPPPPPVLLASISPSNVYARTADFKLELAGDKFSRDVRVFVDGRELPTTYISPQQLSTTVPANMIAAPGARNVEVRSLTDSKLFSNPLPINVADPPKPNYAYIGIIGQPNRIGDVALVQDRNSKNIISLTRGDLLSGRFRVTSISEKELVVTDTSLKIKHVMAMSEGDKGAGPLTRPTPRVDAEDDEP